MYLVLVERNLANGRNAELPVLSTTDFTLPSLEFRTAVVVTHCASINTYIIDNDLKLDLIWYLCILLIKINSKF